MAIFDYSALATKASELLARFGKSNAVIQSTSISASDPAAGTVTEGTPTSVTVNAIQTKQDEHYTPGALIETGDMFWTLDYRPSIGDYLIVDSKARRIINVWPVKPGDTFLASFIQTRGYVDSLFGYVVNNGDYVVNGGIQVVNT